MTTWFCLYVLVFDDVIFVPWYVITLERVESKYVNCKVSHVNYIVSYGPAMVIA